MKIWLVRVNRVAPTPGMVTGSFRAARVEVKVEYYASKESAEKRRDELYSSAKALVGMVDDVEILVSEAEVKP